MPTSEDQLLRTIAKDVQEIKHLMTGGSTPERGLIVRTDRLEQAHKIMARLFWIVVGGILTPGGIVGLGYALISYTTP